MHYHHLGDKHNTFFSWLFFILGIIGALGLRFTLIAQHFNPLLGKVIWYVAIIAFLFFYAFSFITESRKTGLIKKHDIKKRLAEKSLDEDSYESLSRVVD